MIHSVAILGSGQVGTGVALLLASEAPHLSVKLSDINPDTYDQVRAKFAAEGVSLDTISFAQSAPEAVTMCDLVIAAPPPDKVAEVAEAVKVYMLPHAIFTDVASVKGAVIEDTRAALAGSTVRYVPAHPGNGSQGRGPESASKGNIKGPNSPMFLIDDNVTPQDALKTVEAFWSDLGVRTVKTDAQAHDRYFGTCSHFQHLLVFSLLNMARTNPDLAPAFRAGGTAFRNLTRVAISPVKDTGESALVKMWVPIFALNRDNILEAAKRFVDNFDDLAQAVLDDDTEETRELMSLSRSFRTGISETEPRETLQGEWDDALATLRQPSETLNTSNVMGTVILPLLIAHAQTLNAMDAAENIVKANANPSFRDGTALCLNNNFESAAFLENYADCLRTAMDAFQTEIQSMVNALQDGDWDKLAADILSAQMIRNTMPGPRKGANVRPEYTLKVA